MNQLKQFPYQHVLVLGLAKSGTAAAKVLLKNNRNVRVNDGKKEGNEQIAKELNSMGAEVVIGSHPFSVLDGMEIIVKNPGISYDHILIKEAEKRHIPVITEIELAYRLTDNPIIGITGSNGKTTTTTLTSQILEQDKKPVQTAGNIGTVAAEVAETMVDHEWLLLELSSFQLLGVQKFRPKISVLLNIYEAHLDYHKTFDNYQIAKSNIFRNQTEQDYFVYNADDPVIKSQLSKVNAKRVPFSTTETLLNGTWVDEKAIYYKQEHIIDRKEIVLVGEHNLANILASVTVAKIIGVDNASITKILTTFKGVKHRLQYVANINERLFYNDSKATNILATQKALRAFDQPIILLAGGLDRGTSFNELKADLNHVKKMVLFGETAEKLNKIALELGIESMIVNSMEEAVNKAYKGSQENDVILLSPACASWDQYPTFEQRGDMFIDAVHKLA